MILVSACLLGIRCRYDGRSCPAEGLLDALDPSRILPLCPEQLGGLPTPRRPAWIDGGGGGEVLDGRARVMDQAGVDVTEKFLKGVEAALRIVSIVGVERAVLKEKSPSCGVHSTTINGRPARGMGVLAAALHRARIPVASEKELL